MFVAGSFMAKGNYHIGTSGWHYKHWKEGYYPPKLKPADWLNYYAGEFNTAEINASFYRMPTISTVENWAATVRDDFRFCPKISRYLTHMKKLRDPEEPLERFFGVFDHIKDKLGPILMQIPKMVHFKRDVAEHFFKVLKNSYGDHQFALEIRHESWVEKESLKLMKDYEIAFVISQSAGEWPYEEYLTAKHVYVRFHGPAQLYASSYSGEMLKEYAVKFKKWMKKGHQLWIYFNNDIHIHAIHNARTLKKLME
jgi:uncharacterized protein YecE (DUF72 family)